MAGILDAVVSVLTVVAIPDAPPITASTNIMVTPSLLPFPTTIQMCVSHDGRIWTASLEASSSMNTVTLCSIVKHHQA